MSSSHELIKRWNTQVGEVKLLQIINNLSKGRSLSEIKGLDKYAGRWDLRGVNIAKLGKNMNRFGDNKLSQKTKTFKFKRIVLESIDFSYADISYSFWIECDIKNCIFEETKAIEIELIACNISNSIFRKTSLSGSYINENIGSYSGSIKYSEFIDSNISNCIFRFTLIENCSFENCNLKETAFDGSRFKECKFIGILDSIWFRGYAVYAQKSILKIFNRFNPQDYPNRMINVDFTQAKLIGVSFEYSIDLSKCQFPTDNNYLLVKNLKSTYSKAREIIDKEWEGEAKRLGLGYIDQIFFCPKRQDQMMDFIDKHILERYGKNKDINERFFDLIKSLNS